MKRQRLTKKWQADLKWVTRLSGWAKRRHLTIVESKLALNF